MKILTRNLGYAAALAACAAIAFTTGCASGGFKLTRQYAGFVNKQQLILRIVLYILTGIVFAATLLIDLVVFNTMDFWEGRVSAGDYNFKEGEKTYQVRHEVLPETGLKRSTIRVTTPDRAEPQVIVLYETPTHEIEMSIDGQKRVKVQDLSAIPIASIYSAGGILLEERVVPVSAEQITIANQ